MGNVMLALAECSASPLLNYKLWSLGPVCLLMQIQGYKHHQHWVSSHGWRSLSLSFACIKPYGFMVAKPKRDFIVLLGEVGSPCVSLFKMWTLACEEWHQSSEWIQIHKNIGIWNPDSLWASPGCGNSRLYQLSSFFLAWRSCYNFTWCSFSVKPIQWPPVASRP